MFLWLRNHRRWRRALAAAAAALLCLLLVLRVLPAQQFRQLASVSTAVYAADDSLLRLTTAADQQYRVWTPLADISPVLREAVIRYEDRWFYWHFGVNPIALVRSASATFSGERSQGGSTISMQLARRVYGIDSRSVPGKLKQIAAASWLELRYSKSDILEGYLNLAPYGGNIEGVGAASLVYFHKRAAALTLPEALTLAVIPQNPTARGGTRVTGDALSTARSRMASVWLAAHPGEERLGANLAIAPKSASSLPFRAPHVSNLLLSRRDPNRPDGARAEIFSSIDLRMQSTLERVIAQRLERVRTVGINNAAALLLDTRSMQVKALVGSANFFNDDIDGQVNGTNAKRSPGSTLKPFIYALAFDQGVLHPMTVLKDAPTAFGPFSPENFDGRFVGPITAQEALVRSRNVPAVAVAAKLTRPSLYDLMQRTGVAQLASEKHYGLALTLGGGEVTMEELARMYAMLANGGRVRDLAYQRAPDNATPDRTRERVLSDEAAFVVLDMLKTNPRPDTGLPAQPSVAWKTGTSWGFRDAWTAGVFDHHVLIVWMGNFDGSSNPAFIGISAAAPLFFDIVDALRNERRIEIAAATPPPAKLTRVEVCAASGDLPNRECKDRAMSWYQPGKSPIRISTLHRSVLIDQRNGEVVCSESATTRRQIIEVWPSEMLRVFRDAGMPRRDPPKLPTCSSAGAGGTVGATAATSDNQSEPRIVSPLRAVTYTLRLSKPSAITLRAEAVGAATNRLYWFSNEAFLGETKPGGDLSWQPPNAGSYVLRVLDDSGRSDSRSIVVDVVP